MGYEAFIFDLDGTLVHTPPELRYILVGNVLDTLGIRMPETKRREFIDEFWFHTNRSDIITERLGVEPLAFWREYANEDTAELRKEYAVPYSDSGIISELVSLGKRTGIVTGAPSHIAELEISLLGGVPFGSVVIARRDHGFVRKPHPGALIKCMNDLGSEREKKVYVGNAEEDILMAAAAGVYSVLVDRGEHPVGEAAVPSVRLESLYGLHALI